MGLRYLGPIDGHDLPLLISTLEFAKTCDHPIVIHVLTQKGKGYEAALKIPEKFHGTRALRRRRPATRLPAKPGTPPNYQDVFGQTLVKLCQKDNTLVGITAAMPSGTGLKHLEKAMPDRYYDVGIAEEHAVIFAAGMATMGFHPVVRDLLHLPPARLRLHSSRRLPAGFAGDFLHGPRRAFRQRRPDAPRPVRHRLPALPAERHRHGAEGRGRTGGHDVHRHAPAASDVHPLSARRGGRRADQGPAEAARNRQGRGHPELLQQRQAQGRAVRPRPHEHPGAQGGGATGGGRLRLSPSSTRASPSRWTPARTNFSARPRT